MISKTLIELAIQSSHQNGWVSSMSSSQLVRPRTRPAELSGDGREAAVMMLVYPDREGQAQIVLTRRKETLQHHPGQISLPGGRREPGETLRQTGLREIEEEIGVSAERIDVLGELNGVYVPPSDFTVTPVVGWLDERPEFKLQAEEVAELIQVPLASFFDPRNRQNKSVDTDKQDREVPLFEVDGHQIWGATAIIIDDFVQRYERRSGRPTEHGK